MVRSSVDAMDLVIFDSTGNPHRHPMRQTAAGTFMASLDGLDRAATYRLEGDGTWTKTHAITLLHRPEISGLTRQIRLPDYMRIDAPLPVADDARRIDAPEASTVEFVAEVTADAVEGSLQLSERTLESRDVERFDERVWFEDDLPRDAVSETPWKWTTTHAAGGLRSFTFGFDGRPFGMKTRLEPLVLPQDLVPQRSVMLMARLDPADPPTHLAMLLEQEKTGIELVWGDAGAVQQAKGVLRVVAGPLPPPGEWVRLMAPLKSLPQLVGRPVTGVTFRVDHGRLLLDRPGWVDQTTQSVQQPVDRPVGELPVRRSEVHAAGVGSQTWIGGVPVEKPVWASIGFRSEAGYASLPMPAVEIAATIDRPPSIVVDEPPATLTLQVADDVEIRGQAFDDWGLDRVFVRIGPDAQHLADPVPLTGVALADRPPDTQATVSSVLTMEQLGLAPGKSAAWSLVVRDTKGQLTESKVFQVTVVLPPEMALARTQVPALEQARREAEQAARAAEQQAATLDEKRAAVMKAVGEEPLAAIDAAEDAQEQAHQQEQLPKQAQQQPKDSAPPESKPETDPELATAAKEKTAAAQKTADEAARTLEQPRRNDFAAVDAALEQRSREAERMAKSVAQAADQAAQSRLVPQAQKEQLAQLAAEAEALRESLTRNEAFKGDTAKLDRMADAPPQATVAEQAQRLQEALKDVEQRLNAAGAAKRLETLSKDLDRRSQSLAALPKRPQQAATEAVREQVKQVQEILGTAQSEPMKDAAAVKEPAPANDTASQNQPSPANEADPADGASPEPGQQNAPDTKPTTADIEAAAQAAAEAGREAAELASQLAGRKPVSPQQQKPAAAQSEPAADPSADAVESMLQSTPVQEALGMAERARRLEERAARAAAQQAAANSSQPAQSEPAQGRTPGEPSDMQRPGEPTNQLTDGGALAGQADVADPLRGLDASRRAAIYKLPPRVRDPLLEGMRQRGPAAYQDVIDTYFRQLGRDIPQ